MFKSQEASERCFICQGSWAASHSAIVVGVVMKGNIILATVSRRWLEDGVSHRTPSWLNGFGQIEINVSLLLFYNILL